MEEKVTIMHEYLIGRALKMVPEKPTRKLRQSKKGLSKAEKNEVRKKRKHLRLVVSQKLEEGMYEKTAEDLLKDKQIMGIFRAKEQLILNNHSKVKRKGFLEYMRKYAELEDLRGLIWTIVLSERYVIEKMPNCYYAKLTTLYSPENGLNELLMKDKEH